MAALQRPTWGPGQPTRRRRQRPPAERQTAAPVPASGGDNFLERGAAAAACGGPARSKRRGGSTSPRPRPGPSGLPYLPPAPRSGRLRAALAAAAADRSRNLWAIRTPSPAGLRGQPPARLYWPGWPRAARRAAPLTRHRTPSPSCARRGPARMCAPSSGPSCWRSLKGCRPCPPPEGLWGVADGAAARRPRGR